MANLSNIFSNSSLPTRTVWEAVPLQAVWEQVTTDEKVQKCYQAVHRTIAEADRLLPYRSDAHVLYENARNIAENILKAFPKATCSLRAELLCEHAVAANRLGYFGVAIASCTEALINESKLEKTLRADLHHVLGRAYNYMQRYSLSAEHYRFQFKLEKDINTKVYIAFDAINALLKIKDYKKISIASAVGERYSVDPLISAKFTYYHLLSLIELKDHSEIYPLLQTAEKLPINDPILLSLFQNLHGVALLNDGLFVQAIEKFKLCLTNAALPLNVREAATRSIKTAEDRLKAKA